MVRSQTAARAVEGGRSADIAARLAAQIEEDIALGLLHPRERLVEDDLMERFDAKRNTVRNALTTLQSRGAVERRANVGAFVRSFTPKEVVDLYEVRALLEERCARTIAAPLGSADLAPLTAVQHDHDAAVTAGDRRAVLRANLTFHDVLFGLSTNRTLVEAVRHHARTASTIRSVTITDPFHLRRARDEHWAMLRALQDGDGDRLARLCVEHLLPSRDAYLDRLAVD